MRKKFLSAFMLGLLALGTTSTVTSCKDYDDDISGLKSDINAVAGNLEALKSDLTAQIASVNTKIDNLKTELQAAIDKKADKETVQALADNLANNYYTKAQIDEKLKEVNDALANLEKKHDADIVALTGKLDDEAKDRLKADEELTVFINAADKNLQDQIDILKAIKADERLKALEEMLADYPEVWAQVYANQAAIEALEKDVEAVKADVAKCATKEDLENAMQALQEKIDAVNSRVDALVVCVTKRLTSMVFMPNTYILGVEAINFNSLVYNDWYSQTNPSANDLLADAPVGKKNTLSDEDTEVNYYLNPSGVTLDAIEEFSFISNQATNIHSRAAEEAPIKVAKVVSLEGGKLTLKLVKTSTDKFSNGNKDFTIVALKAALAETVKTKAEAGKEVNVFSDWARLTETVIRPYIHDTRAYDKEKDEIISEVENFQDYQDEASAHFYSFSHIYSNPSHPVNFKYAYDDKHIALKVAYNESYDLDQLMMVCDQDGNKIEFEKYGLQFEYNAIDYWVKNGAETDDATNQKSYIAVSGERNNIIKAKTSKGLDDNHDAVGKTPVIQVILRDTRNNAVVDVRYFRVLWTEVSAKPSVETRAEFDAEAPFACGEVYGIRLGEEYLNAEVYAAEGKDGMSQEQFHKTFKLDKDVLYATAEAAAAGDKTKVIGVAADRTSASESTQAHNIYVEFNNGVKLTKEMYDGTPAVLVGYAAFRSADGLQVRIIPVKLSVSYKGPKMSNVYNYNESYWFNKPYEVENADKYVVTNATLTTDEEYGLAKAYTDAQMINDLRNNYIKDGKAPKTNADLVKNADAVKIVFDADRIKAEQATLMPTGKDWAVADGGLTLTYKTKKAAEIDPVTGIVQLYEGNTPGKKGQPSEGALLLVNYDYSVNGTPTADTRNVVPVKVIGTQCSLDVVMDSYLVRFEQPLYFAKSDIATEVIDQIDYTDDVDKERMAGSVDKAHAVNNQITVSEIYGLKRVVWGAKAVTTPNLASWYIVEDLIAKEAKINMSLDGKITEKPETPISKLVNAQGKQLYQLNIVKSAKGNWYVQFRNLYGNALTEDLKAVIPVEISTKWRKNIGYDVNVVIKQNRTPGTDGKAKK